MAGRVESVTIAAESGARLEHMTTAVAVAGRGLEGDRNFRPLDSGNARRNLTLIERDAYQHLASLGINLADDDLRRNLIVSDIALNALVGRRFRVGEVECLGTELCDPCRYIERRTTDGVLKGLVERGGLCAEILTSGRIAIGDSVEAID